MAPLTNVQQIALTLVNRHQSFEINSKFNSFRNEASNQIIQINTAKALVRKKRVKGYYRKVEGIGRILAKIEKLPEINDSTIAA